MQIVSQHTKMTIEMSYLLLSAIHHNNAGELPCLYYYSRGSRSLFTFDLSYVRGFLLIVYPFSFNCHVAHDVSWISKFSANCYCHPRAATEPFRSLFILLIQTDLQNPAFYCQSVSDCQMISLGNEYKNPILFRPALFIFFLQPRKHFIEPITPLTPIISYLFYSPQLPHSHQLRWTQFLTYLIVGVFPFFPYQAFHQ